MSIFIFSKLKEIKRKLSKFQFIKWKNSLDISLTHSILEIKREQTTFWESHKTHKLHSIYCMLIIYICKSNAISKSSFNSQVYCDTLYTDCKTLGLNILEKYWFIGIFFKFDIWLKKTLYISKLDSVSDAQTTQYCIFKLA